MKRNMLQAIVAGILLATFTLLCSLGDVRQAKNNRTVDTVLAGGRGGSGGVHG